MCDNNKVRSRNGRFCRRNGEMVTKSKSRKISNQKQWENRNAEDRLKVTKSEPEDSFVLGMIFDTLTELNRLALAIAL